MPVDVKYRTTATALGGRDGQARTEDGSFAVKLSTPKELGGAGGDGANPEQLFAAGYSACFIGALKAAGQQRRSAERPVPSVPKVRPARWSCALRPPHQTSHSQSASASIATRRDRQPWPAPSGRSSS